MDTWSAKEVERMDCTSLLGLLSTPTSSSNLRLQSDSLPTSSSLPHLIGSPFFPHAGPIVFLDVQVGQNAQFILGDLFLSCELIKTLSADVQLFSGEFPARCVQQQSCLLPE